MKQNLRPAKLQLGPLLFGNILHRTLVEKHLAGLVPDNTRRLGNPDPRAILPENLRLELLNTPLLLNECQEQIPLPWLHV